MTDGSRRANALRWPIVAACLAACSRAGVPVPLPLVLVQTQPVTMLQPGRENGAVSQELAALLGRYLVTIDPHEHLVGDAASAVPNTANGGIAGHGTILLYHLRPGLRFSDGSRLEARDVVATLDALRDPRALLPSRLGIEDVREVDAPDRLTVRVRLEHPFAPILLYLCGPGNATPILPAAVARTLLTHDTRRVPPIGAGPYTLTSYLPGDHAALAANPWYSPRPRIPNLILRTVPSSATALVQLQTGEASGYMMADPALEPQLRQVGGLRTHATPVDGIGALVFNVTRAAVSDSRVRRAIASAIAVRRDVRRVFHGGVSTRDAAAGLFLWAYAAKAFTFPAYDPAKARRLLRLAGWRAQRLTVIVRSDQPSSGALALNFAAELRDVGIPVRLRSYPIEQWQSPDGPLYRGRFDIAIVQWLAGFDPDVTDQFACDRIPPHGYNKPRYCNPALDRLLAAATSTYDRTTRIALYSRAQRILAHDLPIVPLYRLVSLDTFPRALLQVTPTEATPFYGAANWRFAP